MKDAAGTPDRILYNARVYTLDPARPWAAAVAMRGGRILAVGSDADILALAGPAATRMDLGGRLVLPGLCDAHIHFYHWSLARQEVQLADCRSRAEFVARVAAAAQTTPAGAWIVGRGWNESWWGETHFPTAADLDPVSRAHPVILWRSDHHAAVANAAALRLAGITAATGDPPHGVIDRDATGAPTGLLRELAIDLVARHLPEITSSRAEAALAAGAAELHRLGVTAIHDQRMKDHGDGPLVLSALGRMREQGLLKLRVSCNVAAHQLPEVTALGLRSGFGDDYLRLGHIKVFADGSLGSRTAWLLQPYAKAHAEEADRTGVILTPPAQMAAEFRRAAEHGFPISVHAIGDQANRVVLDIFEELASAGFAPVIPHRIEHVQIIDPVDLPRLAKLGITASVQPIHAIDDIEVADRWMGARGAHMYNFRSLLVSGARLAFGSDAPVANPNPFIGIHAALTRQRPDHMEAAPWYPDERITLEQALYAYTMGAAEASGWQTVIGSITPGKAADLIAVDRDLFALAQEKPATAAIAETQVVLTLFDGETVCEQVS